LEIGHQVEKDFHSRMEGDKSIGEDNRKKWGKSAVEKLTHSGNYVPGVHHRSFLKERSILKLYNSLSEEKAKSVKKAR